MRSGSRTRTILLWLCTISSAVAGAVNNAAFLSARMSMRPWSRNWSQGVSSRIPTVAPKSTAGDADYSAQEGVWVQTRMRVYETDTNDAFAAGSSAYKLDLFRAGPDDLPILHVQLHDGRQFAFVDWCPPTGHTLCNSVVDADVLSIEDVVFGTRFDLRTGKVRGQWCPGLKGIAGALPSSPLKALQLRVGEGGEAEILIPNKETSD